MACSRLPFERVVGVAEASSAVWVEASFGLPAHVLVVGDSGTRGALAIVDAGSGAGLGTGRLPLEGGVSDDIEGLARAGDIYYALTSGGYMRHYRRTGATTFELAVKAYALAGVSCDSPRRTNCGRDFEGLCLAEPLRGGGCAGFAASRRDGELVCLTAGEGGRLRADAGQTIRVTLRRALSGCDIAPPTDGQDGQALYAATNMFGGNTLVRVHGWRDPATSRIERLAGAGTGFIEAVAVAPKGIVYRFSDTATPTSGMGKYSCPAAGPE